VGSPGRGRLLIDRLIRSADVVRANIEGIGWLHPGRSPEAVAYQWLHLGPKLAVITCGADGVMAVNSRGAVVHRPAHPARALNPVGADDTFTAGLLAGLHDQNPGPLSTSDIARLIDLALAACATITTDADAVPVSPPLATSGR
jgi:fructokinase